MVTLTSSRSTTSTSVTLRHESNSVLTYAQTHATYSRTKDDVQRSKHTQSTSHARRASRRAQADGGVALPVGCIVANNACASLSACVAESRKHKRSARTIDSVSAAAAASRRCHHDGAVEKYLPQTQKLRGGAEATTRSKQPRAVKNFMRRSDHSVLLEVR